MKIALERKQLRLIPEDDQDVSYIEDTLGLVEGVSLKATRRIDTLNGLEVVVERRGPDAD